MYYVDEQGRNNFGADDAGSYGENLVVGADVRLASGEVVRIREVYSTIQTGPSGSSNYVAVDLE